MHYNAVALNVLLSFAQFEREVTGERIRDKIAASKAKGMWMGGYPPLGYAVKDRTLLVVSEEADTVRHIYERYLSLKSVKALAEDLEAAGTRSKRHVSASGQERGGTTFSHGALFHLLRNRIYIGEIVHKKQSYRGQHEPIIELSLFERVQRRLAKNSVRRGKRQFDSAPLTGLVVDPMGARMAPAHAYGKGGARYRYYVSNVSRDCAETGRADYVPRVSAAVLEELVLDRMRAVLGQAAAGWPAVLKVLRKVEVRTGSVTLEIAGTPNSDSPNHTAADAELKSTVDGLIRIKVPACMQPHKGSTRVTAPAARLGRAHHDKPLIAALKRAHRELGKHGFSLARNAAELSQARGLGDPYLRRIAPLAFLAPDIQHAIVTGRQPAGLTLKRLTHDDLPLDWQMQRTRFGFNELSTAGIEVLPLEGLKPTTPSLRMCGSACSYATH